MSVLIMSEIRLFYGQIYTAVKNFTLPPVVKVGTNLTYDLRRRRRCDSCNAMLRSDVKLIGGPGCIKCYVLQFDFKCS